jgi:hypothetical protein
MKQVAQELRQLAQEFERFGCAQGLTFTDFTCNAVLNLCGRETSDAYADIFGFLPETEFKSSANSRDLWHSANRGSLRVMLLCFAAAMAETGDL